MPVMNGWDFRRKQRETPAFADIPVLLMSAGAHMADRQRRAGCRRLRDETGRGRRPAGDRQAALPVSGAGKSMHALPRDRPSPAPASADRSARPLPADQVAGRRRAGRGLQGPLLRAGRLRTHRGRQADPAGNCEDPEFVRMFVAEAKILGMLHHPNVVQAYDVGESDGTLFLVLEYVDGPSLGRLMRALRTAERAACRSAVAAHFAQRDLPGARLRAQPARQRRRAAERHPPRRHAVEHRADVDGLAEAARLRHREVRVLGGRDPPSDGQGQAGVPGARGDRGRAASTRGSTCSRSASCCTRC